MLAKQFDLDESYSYDQLSDEQLEEILKTPQKIDIDKPTQFHTFEEQHIPFS